MKKLVSLFAVLILASQIVYSQWLNGISIYPPSPTETDQIKVIVNGSFPSGGCSDWSIVNQSQNGNEYTFYDLHCIGMLMYICDNIDTINLGLLAAGTYSVIIDLSAGNGSFPCNQAYPWDVDTAFFTVTTVTGLSEPGENNFIGIRPNPLVGKQFSIILPERFNGAGPYNLSISDLNGREIKRTGIPGSGNVMNIDLDLLPGIYIVTLSGPGQFFKPAKVIIY